MWERGDAERLIAVSGDGSGMGRRVEADLDGGRVGSDVTDGALVLTSTGADRHIVGHARLLVDDRRQPMTVLVVRLRATTTRT